MDKPRTIFAYDFGTSNIGLAVGQEVTKTAHTFFTLKAKNGIPFWDELDELVSEWSPDLFLVGNPLNMDGSRSDMQDLTDIFSKNHSPGKLIDGISAFTAASMSSTEIRGVKLPLNEPDAPTCNANFIAADSEGKSAIIMKSVLP